MHPFARLLLAESSRVLSSLLLSFQASMSVLFEFDTKAGPAEMLYVKALDSNLVSRSVLAREPLAHWLMISMLRHLSLCTG
jgi:hypothetical protein